MKQILDAAALDRAIRRLSHEIEERNDGLRDVALIGIRTRGMVVAERIRDFSGRARESNSRWACWISLCIGTISSAATLW